MPILTSNTKITNVSRFVKVAIVIHYVDFINTIFSLFANHDDATDVV
jgi:hypothetical protein